jgi:hypothetical protein
MHHPRRCSSTLIAIAVLTTAPFLSTTVRAEDTGPTLSELEARLAVLEANAQKQSSSGNFRLINLSLNVLTAAGGSTATDEELLVLQGGGHDPRRRGFTFQGAELSIGGAIRDWFEVQSHAVLVREEPEGETGIELEEAYGRTTALPGGLEVKVGQYFLEFGRFNQQHPHQWMFIDQSLVVGRFFGPDGQRSPGARLAVDLPTDWSSRVLVGSMDANGETVPSFLSNDEAGSIGGRSFTERGTRSMGDLLWNGRWVNGFGGTSAHQSKFGVSAVTGPNSTADDGRTLIWGVDAAYRWQPEGALFGWPFAQVEGEFMQRRYRAGASDLVDGTGAVVGTADEDTLSDRGWVLQATYGFVQDWAVGLRYEQVRSVGDSIAEVDDGVGGTVQALVDPDTDASRDRRSRISPLIAWWPAETVHLRLQYNYDDAEHRDDKAHSVFLGAEFMIGSHTHSGW